ncbi:MAG TPA: uracil-DNA glycosylase [Rugosimonospora sp.]|nr:uracil-DNA glycosylase [Rugosimonospora sp.]
MTGAWSTLAAEIRSCVACPELVAARTRVVVGDPPAYGDPGGRVRLAFVGEAPGAQEDAAGRPFVGKAGQLLDQLLTDSGLARAEVAVLNVVKCRPPHNRPPRADEVARCRPYLCQQLDLLRPRLVVALGLTAAAWFLGRRTSLAAARGTVHRADGRPVIATYHPSAAIRFGPNGAPLAALREDLDFAARLLAEEATA